MKVDVSRIRAHIETLAGYTRTPGAGTTRLSYSPQYRQACDYLVAYALPEAGPSLLAGQVDF